jgi:hypothetical protein
MKRHFKVEHSGRPPREGYRIDHTSIDGSGLQRDDGAQFHEELPLDMADEVEALHPPTKGIR